MTENIPAGDLTEREIQILQQMENPCRPFAARIEPTQAERRRLKGLGLIEFKANPFGPGAVHRWRLTRVGELRATETAS
jgi:hypothetical protein